MEKVALILIHSTWLLISLLRSMCVSFFYNEHATIMNLSYFNPHSLQLTVYSSVEPLSHGYPPPSVPVDGMMV